MLPRTDEEIEKWIKLPVHNIATYIDDRCKHIMIYYMPSIFPEMFNIVEIDNGTTLIIGNPPVHVYIRTAYYEKQNYNRIIVGPF